MSCTPPMSGKLIETCPVLGCQTAFSSKHLLDEHMLRENHHPCNPYRHLVDQKIKCSSGYACPICQPTQLFNSKVDCLQHIFAMKHGQTVHPVKIAGIACPQCLCIHSTSSQCKRHMVENFHFRYAHPFPDDSTECGSPLLMPQKVWIEFVRNCLTIPWHTCCLHCQGLCLGPYDEQFNKIEETQRVINSLQSHTREGHVVEACSPITQVDAVCYLMKYYSCNVCYRLFAKHPSRDEHSCPGVVSRTQVRRFQEFLLRCALKPSSVTAAENKSKVAEDDFHLESGEFRGVASFEPFNWIRGEPIEASPVSPVSLLPLSRTTVSWSAKQQEHASKAPASGSTVSQSPESRSRVSRSLVSPSGVPSWTVPTSPESRSDASCSTSPVSRLPVNILPASRSRKSSHFIASRRLRSPVSRSPVSRDDVMTCKRRRLCDDDDVMTSVSPHTKIRRSDPVASSSRPGESISSELSAGNSRRDMDSSFEAVWTERQSTVEDMLVEGPHSPYDSLHSISAGYVDPESNSKRWPITSASSSSSKSFSNTRKSTTTVTDTRSTLKPRDSIGFDSLASTSAPAPLFDVASLNSCTVGSADCSAFCTSSIAEIDPDSSSSTSTYTIFDSAKSIKTSVSDFPFTDRHLTIASVNPGLSDPTFKSNSTQSKNVELPSLRDCTEPSSASVSLPSSESVSGTINSTPPLSKSGGSLLDGHSTSAMDGAVCDGLVAGIEAGFSSCSSRAATTAMVCAPLSNSVLTWSRGCPGSTINLNLTGYNQLIFVDLDNWINFFSKLPGNLPNNTFVWCFYGGSTKWKEPLNSATYIDAKRRGIVHVHPSCGTRKDAADFAICLQVGRLNELLANNVTFTILSGDGGFQELEKQCSVLRRRTKIVNPHVMSSSFLYALLRSVVET